MRQCENIQELVKLSPDYIGFIFYKKSKRFVADFPKTDIPETIKKVGVFVDESIVKIVELVLKHQLDAVQLHGDESVDFCKILSRHPELVSGSHQTEIFKAFSVEEHFDFLTTKGYAQYCDLFIFDTKGKGYGGTGLKYDWKLLEKYKGETPFLLSGGIRENDDRAIANFQHPKCVGVDLNSGFENSPGIKNIKKLQAFKQQLYV